MSNCSTFKVYLTEARGFVEITMRETADHPWTGITISIVAAAPEAGATSWEFPVSPGELHDLGVVFTAAHKIGDW